MLTAMLSLRRETPPDMPTGNLILATHEHLDHLDPRLVNALTGKGTALIGPEVCRRKMGDLMHAVVPGDRITDKGAVVRVVHAYNPEGSRKTIYHPKGRGVGYIVEVDGHSVYHAGDTGLIEEMRGMGPMDVALLPIGGRYTMDPREAAQAAADIGAKIVVPIHLLRSDPAAFKEAIEATGGPQVRVLSPGEPLVLGEDGHADNKL